MSVIRLLSILLSLFWGIQVLIAQNKPNLVIQENHAGGIFKVTAHPQKELIATADGTTVKLWDSRSWKILHSVTVISDLQSDWTILSIEFNEFNHLIVTIVELLPDPNNFFVSYLLSTRKITMINILTGKITEHNTANAITFYKKENTPLSIYQQDSMLVFQNEKETIYSSLPKNINDSYLFNSDSWFLDSKISHQITFARFNLSKSLVVCGYSDGTIELRNAKNYTSINTFETDLNQITDVHFSGDSLLICEGTNTDDQLIIINLLEKEVNQTFVFDCIYLDKTNRNQGSYGFAPLIFDQVCNFGTDFHEPSGWLATASQFNRLYFINIHTKVKKYIDCPFSAIYDISFSRDGKELYLTGVYWGDSTDIFSQSPILTYNLSTETFSNTPNIIFDYANHIGWTDSGDAFYSLNLSSFTKWSLKNLSRTQTNIVNKRHVNFTNFIKGSHHSFIEIPPSYDKPFFIHHFNKQDTSIVYLNFLKAKEEEEMVVGLIKDQFVVTASYNTTDYFIYDLKSTALVYVFKLASDIDFKISDNGYWLVLFQRDEAKLNIINTRTWKRAFEFPIDREVVDNFNIQNNFSFSRDNQKFSFFQDRIYPPDENEMVPPSLHHIQVYSLDPQQKWQSLSTFKYGRPINLLTFGYSNNTILMGTENPPYDIQVWDFINGKKTNTFSGHDKSIELIADHKKMIFSKSEDNTYRLWQKDNGEEVLKIMNYFDGIGISEVMITKDNYYLASAKGLQMVGYQIGEKGYPFEQFDLRQNRPDKVIEAISNMDTTLIKAYKNAYLKRLKKMNFTPQMFNDGYHVPELSIKPMSNETTTRNRKITMEINVNDKNILLDRINIWVNDVPIFGRKGISVRDKKIHSFKDSISFELSKGSNKIQVSAMNTSGGESSKETFIKNYVEEKGKDDLYIIAIGISKYQNKKNNLDYPTVDMDSLIQLFKTKETDYRKIHFIPLYNEQVTVENISAIKKELLKSKTDDKVIIAYAGHGLIGSDYQYYLSTYNGDFFNPKDKGLPYDVLENLLDSIPARNKLLLVDACHSGEIDTEYLEKIKTVNKESKNTKFRIAGDSTLAYNKLGISNSFELMKLLFVDLRRSTGATVISSSGGIQQAIESKNWNNSAFIHCLLLALKQKEADGKIDGKKNGKISVSELSAYLSEQVSKITNGLQQPTSRVLNLENDFQIW